MSSNTYYTNTIQYENLKGNTTVTYYCRSENDTEAFIKAKNKHKINAERNTTKFVNSFFN